MKPLYVVLIFFLMLGNAGPDGYHLQPVTGDGGPAADNLNFHSTSLRLGFLF